MRFSKYISFFRQENSLQGLRGFSSFSANRERQKVSHVIMAFPLGLRYVVHVCTARPRSCGK